MKTITPRGFGQKEEYLWMTDVNTMFAEMEADLESIKDYQKYMRERDGVIGGNHTLGVGTGTSTKVRMSGAIHYRISGVEYSAQDLEVVLATGEITHNTNGAWRITINKAGTLATQRATANGTSGTMAFASAETALLSLTQIARPANTVDVGYLMIHATNGAGGFTPGDDDPATTDAQVDVATYYNCRMPRIDNGFTATPSVGLSVGTTKDEYAFGTINVRTNGLNKAQISADTTITFAQADIITTLGKYGAHLFVTNTAGSAILSLAATGIAGSAQTMDYTLAQATAALDAAQLALPSIFTVIGRETCLAAKATFTYDTDKIDGTALHGLSTFTDELSGDFSRATMGATGGTGVKNDPPDIPAATTAATLAFSGL